MRHTQNLRSSLEQNVFLKTKFYFTHHTISHMYSVQHATHTAHMYTVHATHTAHKAHMYTQHTQHTKHTCTLYTQHTQHTKHTCTRNTHNTHVHCTQSTHDVLHSSLQKVLLSRLSISESLKHRSV